MMMRYDTMVLENELEEARKMIITENDFSENLKEIIDEKNFHITELLERLNEAIKKLDEYEKVTALLEEIKEQEKELFGHLVSVSILAQQIGIWAKWEDYELEYAALGGMLHDIGLFQTIEKKKKKIPFKDELQGHGYEKHVTEGTHLLKTLRIDQEVIKAVLGHHERIDGNGFPMRLSGAMVNKIARALAVADTYDVYTMKQKGEYGWPLLIALQRMEDEGSRKLDSGLVQVFIEHIVEKAVGKTAVLSDGSTGKIVMINKYDLLYPIVDCRGRSMDLSMMKRVCVEDIVM